MSPPKQKLLIAPQEYLAFERRADERHEWLDGVIRQMAGESPQHSIICSTVNASFNFQLRLKPCATFSPNMNVYSRLATDTTMKGLFSYPDTLVVCGPPQFHDQHRDVLTNSKVVEVFSASTENYDRTEKFERYALNSSLTGYILISQHRSCVEHYASHEQGLWQYYRATTLTDSIYLASINCRLSLTEVYDRIEFKTPEPEEENGEPQNCAVTRTSSRKTKLRRSASIVILWRPNRRQNFGLHTECLRAVVGDCGVIAKPNPHGSRTNQKPSFHALASARAHAPSASPTLEDRSIKLLLLVSVPAAPEARSHH